MKYGFSTTQITQLFSINLVQTRCWC